MKVQDLQMYQEMLREYVLVQNNYKIEDKQGPSLDDYL